MINPPFKDFYEHWSDDEFDESEDSDDDDIDDDFELYDLDEGNLSRGIDNKTVRNWGISKGNT